MKILVIEDEAAVISLIERGLKEKGLEVSIAMDGNTGLQMIRDHPFNLVIMDLMLPGMNGIQICREIRSLGFDLPVLMLTALGSTENIVTGLDSGADDYMVKPFKINELVARVNALGRRAFKKVQTPEKNILQIGDLQLDTDAKMAKRNEEIIPLTSTEYKLLEFFMKNQSRVLSRMEILENVWDIDFNLGTNVVDVYVNYLRKKIDKSHDTKFIHTMIGMGYMMKETAS
ncbi:response regulator transcription factor [Sediminibacterium goheungense]|uniref:Winged helix family two component transcriptional regulator n=1 Tax=Sediminibacterium goheungense TaxID=1086393 RepID=A0A4R6IWL4_9BACT|nr:response regulator transcription factor [Sediminibacterium goheungense]TDO27094.1 winged helix family two component transcriptional regulator [Sediminibacterium goheungense]